VSETEANLTETQAKIIAALEAGPLNARELWRIVSGSDALWKHYCVAVELQPMIRAGLVQTDCAHPLKDDDRVVTSTETISLVPAR
jgi:hypothetical protein